ncbi:MAG: hypothetical protein R2811_17920 [Flavobacteriales bacterium]
MLTSAWVLAGLVVLITGASLWKFQVWWVRMFDLPRAPISFPLLPGSFAM